MIINYYNSIKSPSCEYVLANDAPVRESHAGLDFDVVDVLGILSQGQRAGHSLSYGDREHLVLRLLEVEQLVLPVGQRLRRGARQYYPLLLLHMIGNWEIGFEPHDQSVDILSLRGNSSMLIPGEDL